MLGGGILTLLGEEVTFHSVGKKVFIHWVLQILRTVAKQVSNHVVMPYVKDATSRTIKCTDTCTVHPITELFKF